MARDSFSGNTTLTGHAPRPPRTAALPFSTAFSQSKASGGHARTAAPSLHAPTPRRVPARHGVGGASGQGRGPGRRGGPGLRTNTCWHWGPDAGGSAPGAELALPALLAARRQRHTAWGASVLALDGGLCAPSYLTCPSLISRGFDSWVRKTLPHWRRK